MTPGIAKPAFKMTFGQMSEVFFLLLLPWFFLKLGIKWVLTAGMLAWLVRYALFALGAPDAVTWMLIAGICLHGPCYDFVYVAGQIYIDTQGLTRQFEPRLRVFSFSRPMASDKGWARWPPAGSSTPSCPAPAVRRSLEQWQMFWMFPLIFALVVTALFMIGFRDEVPARQARPRRTSGSH